jgi:Icc-related predicted phosphoesterase
LKICFTSDLHGKLPKIPNCDLLCLVGDFLVDFGKDKRAFEINWAIQRFHPWLDRIQERGIKVLAVAGNHDYLFYTYPEIRNIFNYYLEWNSVEINGFIFYGCPSHSLENRPFYQTESDKDKLLSKCDKCDFFLTHEPAYGILDRMELENIGSKAVLKHCERLNPELHVCGHYHSGFGQYKNHINVSYSVDPHYSPIVHSVVLYDTETKKFELY